MCKQKIEGKERICINTRCEDHMLSDNLRLVNPNFKSTAIWVFLGCMRNLNVLKDGGEKFDLVAIGDSWEVISDDVPDMKIFRSKLSGLTLGAIGESWGMTRERVRQIEVEAVKRFKHNYKTMLKEEMDYA